MLWEAKLAINGDWLVDIVANGTTRVSNVEVPYKFDRVEEDELLEEKIESNESAVVCDEGMLIK